jgi:hypothetical protein
MAEARANEERVQRDLQEKKAAAEQEAADLRRRKAEAAAAARLLLPEVKKAVRSLSSERRLQLEKLTKPGWWGGKPRHMGWVLVAGGSRFEVSFSGLVTVSGQKLEEFVDTGLIAHYWSYNDSSSSESGISWQPVTDILDDFLTAAAAALARTGR